MVLGIGARVAFGVRCRGTANIPRTGPVVLLANHQSHLDPVLIGCFCPRPLGILARESLFKGTVATLIRSFDAIPIDRDGSGLGGIRITLKRLKDGDAILIFPEGTRSHDGQLQPIKPGFTALVRRGKATIIPVAIDGAFQALPRGRAVPRRNTIAIVYGAPIDPGKVAELDDAALVAEIERRLAEGFARAGSLVQGKSPTDAPRVASK